MIYSNGDYYVGDFFNGKIDGKGTLISQNSAKYEGD
jgi:MORN repeat.